MDRHDHGDRDWMVVAVMDPDDEGREYAYTNTLAGRGVPDLHLWARPPDGEDPGADWRLSRHDMGQLLDELALGLIEGALRPGAEVVRTYDGGLVTARYQLGTPVPALTLDALMLPVDAPVIPVRWSLHRPPPAGIRPLDEVTRSSVVVATHEITRRTAEMKLEAGARPSPVPREWRAPRPGSVVDVSTGQRFGPLTALVQATAEQILHAPAPALAAFLGHAAELHAMGVTGWAHTWARAQARPAGRHGVVDEALAAGPELARLVTGAPGPTRRWRESVAPWLEGMDRSERMTVKENLAHFLEHTLQVTLAGETIADVAPPDLLVVTRGPWAWAHAWTFGPRAPCGCLRPPGPGWEASWEAETWVGDRLAELPLSGARGLEAAARQALTAPDFGDFTGRLTTHRLTGPCTPAIGEVRTSDGVRALLPDAGPDLCRFARLLLIGVTVPDRVTDGAWARPVAPLLPHAPAFARRPAFLLEAV